MNETPAPKRSRKPLLIALLIVLIVAVVVALSLRDTRRTDFPPSVTAFYSAPEVTPETRERFESLFIDSSEETDVAFRELAGHLADLREYGESEPKPRAYWLAIDGAWSRFEPFALRFRDLAAEGPFPLDLRPIDQPGIDGVRWGDILEIHLLRAESLKHQGRDPSPAIKPVFQFLDQYFRSASNLLDLFQVQKGYRQLLEHRDDAFLTDYPEGENAAAYFIAQWRQKLANALKLEFFLLKDYLNKAASGESGASAPGRPPVPMMSGFLFKKNETLNRYWDWLDRLATAVATDDTDAFVGIEAEIQALRPQSHLTNLFGITLLKTIMPNVPDIYDQFHKLEEKLYQEPRASAAVYRKDKRLSTI